jgi:hypothetical protein
MIDRLKFAMNRCCRVTSSVAFLLVCNCSSNDEGVKPGNGHVVHDPVTFEPNDSPETAAPISLGQLIRSSHPAGDPADYFSLPVSANHIYTLQLWFAGYGPASCARRHA